MNHECGVITLAVEKDYKKAIALALTLKEHSPSLPISIVCSNKLTNFVSPYFDKVIIERSDLKGFEHKLYLDEYSPYINTFFFDADILIIKDILPIINLWSGSDYAVRGYIITKEKGKKISNFGLDRINALQLIDKKEFSVIDGAGHAYFEKPACKVLFNTAREILKEYPKYKANSFADEDAVGIAMTKLDIKPKDNNAFLGSPWCAQKGSFKIDTNKGICTYVDKQVGIIDPYVVHFPRFVYPYIYTVELKKIFKKNNVRIGGLYSNMLVEIFTGRVLWRLSRLKKRLF